MGGARVLAGWLIAACGVLLVGCDESTLEQLLATDAGSDADSGGDAVAGEDALPVGDVGSDAGLAPLPVDLERCFEGATPGASPLGVRFEPEAADFWRTPWPSNHRTDERGSPVLGEFRELTRKPLLNKYIASIEGVVDGYSTMPVGYFSLGSDPGVGSLPDAAKTRCADAPVQLVAVDEATCGRRVPVETRIAKDPDRYLPGTTLQVSPVVGFVLPPKSTWAFVVMDTFGSSAGLRPDAGASFGAALAGDGGAVSASLEPLRRCAARGGIALDRVAVATVFTTQDPVRELIAMREVAQADVAAPSVRDWAEVPDRSQAGKYRTWQGVYDTPIFQRGESPYTEGGGIEVDAEGRPKVQRMEPVPFAITVPDTGAASYPVLIWVDGTGASLFGYVGDSVSSTILGAGWAIATYTPQFHDRRATPGSDTTFSTFNYTNPESGRTVFRQQAVDTSFLIRVLREASSDMPGLPALDTARMAYGGQSQGAIVGAISAGIEPDIEAYVLNGIGGYLSSTVVFRTDPVDIPGTLSALLGTTRSLDRFHPVVQLAQIGSDAVDPHNYAWRWKGWSENPDGTSVFLMNGKGDPTTAEDGMNSLVIAGDVSPISPAGWSVDPYRVWDRTPQPLPIEGNRVSVDGTPITFVTWMSPSTTHNHFTIYRDRAARATAGTFWRTGRTGTPRAETPAILP